ncbi:RNA polymerase II C-terminal domain kinase beta subunit [Mortierella sp. AD031]|nr:RNA polymerase II C-terminal domain kinase beta subunit [Mortierella sp. AD031]
MPGELRQPHHLSLEQQQQPPPPPPPAPPLQTLPMLNSINRVSRTYYSKHDQGVVYSARTPGISLHRQTDMRRESCEIIAAIGKRIGFTAQLLLHRFFMFNSVQDTGNEVVMACLFVSSKVEDTIKKLKDIMIATYIFRHPHATDWDPESKEGEEQRKRVLLYEKMVLESICFDFRIIHPYNYIIKFVKIMQGSKQLARQAWDIARDSHQMLDLLSIGRSDEQRQLYDKIHITLHDARQLDIQHQQPPLKKARTEHSRTIGVQAELERIQDGGASNPTVRYSQS